MNVPVNIPYYEQSPAAQTSPDVTGGEMLTDTEILSNIAKLFNYKDSRLEGPICTASARSVDKNGFLKLEAAEHCIYDPDNPFINENNKEGEAYVAFIGGSGIREGMPCAITEANGVIHADAVILSTNCAKPTNLEIIPTDTPSDSINVLNETVWIVGIGDWGLNTPNPGRVLFGKMKVEDIGPKLKSDCGVLTENNLCLFPDLDSDIPGTACYGDSGGPIIIIKDGKPIARGGITSQTSSKNPCQTFTKAESLERLHEELTLCIEDPGAHRNICKEIRILTPKTPYGVNEKLFLPLIAAEEDECNGTIPNNSSKCKSTETKTQSSAYLAYALMLVATTMMAKRRFEENREKLTTTVNTFTGRIRNILTGR